MPPELPKDAIMCKIKSLEHTPLPRAPSASMSICFGLDCKSVCVASTISTSLVPMPNAMLPNAPWVEVWLSPQTIVIPQCVIPCSGPIMWTIPLAGSPNGKYLIPCLAVFFASCSTGNLDERSFMGRCCPFVGTLWSHVAKVCEGRNTLRPRFSNPSKAWGLVTSWMK